MAKKFLGVTIDETVKADLELIAADEHRSVSNMAEFFLRKGVTHRKEQLAIHHA
jgi:hypothetical protein